jgi:3-phenylpropionate/trans-cinnamate dioxygenase ferredoxin reductase subunit
MIWRGEPAAERKWGVGWLSGGRLAAMLTVSSPRDLLQARRLIEAGAGVDAAKLADPTVAVRDCAV